MKWNIQSYLDLIDGCTNIPKEILEFIPDDQLDSICEDIVKYSSDKKKSGDTAGVVIGMKKPGIKNKKPEARDKRKK